MNAKDKSEIEVSKNYITMYPKDWWKWKCKNLIGNILETFKPT